MSSDYIVIDTVTKVMYTVSNLEITNRDRQRDTEMTIYTIQSTYEVNSNQYTSSLEYYETENEARVGLRHWAARHDAIERISQDGLYFDYWNGRQQTSFLVSKMEEQA